MKNKILLSMFMLVLASVACAAHLSLEIPAFSTGTPIPAQYTCQGANHSPALQWHGAPKGTLSYVLMVEDPDAPKGTWVHWLLFNIPATINQLGRGARLPLGAISGKNSWGEPGYRGPCPPSGQHRYYFKLYALDARLTVNSSVNNEDIQNAMQDHVLGYSEWMGLYGNK